MEWILSEVVELLKENIEMTDHLLDMCKEQKDLFKDQFNTNDKFEVAKHEFWRGRISGLKNSKNTLKGLLDDIYDMIEEESCTQEAYDDNVRELRGDANGRL